MDVMKERKKETGILHEAGVASKKGTEAIPIEPLPAFAGAIDFGLRDGVLFERDMAAIFCVGERESHKRVMIGRPFLQSP